MDRERALGLIYHAIDIVNRQLPPARRLTPHPDTIIAGAGSPLDSLALVNFAVALDEAVTDATGRDLRLLDRATDDAAEGAFRSVDALAAHLVTAASTAS